MFKKIDNVLEDASRGLDEESRTILYKSLSLIHNNLKNICKDYNNDDE